MCARWASSSTMNKEYLYSCRKKLDIWFRRSRSRRWAAQVDQIRRQLISWVVKFTVRCEHRSILPTRTCRNDFLNPVTGFIIPAWHDQTPYAQVKYRRFPSPIVRSESKCLDNQGRSQKPCRHRGGLCNSGDPGAHKRHACQSQSLDRAFGYHAVDDPEVGYRRDSMRSLERQRDNYDEAGELGWVFLMSWNVYTKQELSGLGGKEIRFKDPRGSLAEDPVIMTINVGSVSW